MKKIFLLLLFFTICLPLSAQMGESGKAKVNGLEPILWGMSKAEAIKAMQEMANAEPGASIATDSNSIVFRDGKRIINIRLNFRQNKFTGYRTEMRAVLDSLSEHRTPEYLRYLDMIINSRKMLTDRYDLELKSSQNGHAEYTASSEPGDVIDIVYEDGVDGQILYSIVTLTDTSLEKSLSGKK